MNILGISAYYHDSAACLIRSGKIVAAAQEERFTRKKHDASFPTAAIDYCLNSVNITSSDIDYIVYYEKPFHKFDRLLETYLTFAPKGITQALFSLPAMVKEKIWVKDAINKALPDSGPILFTGHHTSHAASAFFPSPFEQAAYLTVDGVGEQCTTSYGYGNGNKLTPLQEIIFPHSLGLLYSAFTAYCGFRVNSDEYKLMGLAPYGTPRYVQLIFDHLIDLKEDGSFRLNMDYFSYCTDMVMTSSRFHDLFEGAPLNSGDTPQQRQMDIASSIQVVTEEVLLRLARHLHRETGNDSLCLAGGVALNCVANGRLLREGPFKNIWIQPAAGDAGSALGAALWGWHQYLDQPRHIQEGSDQMYGSLLGPSFSSDKITEILEHNQAHFQKLDEEDLLERTAELLAAGKVVGWHQGRMEYGPRALGNRSILADPRLPNMQSIVNQKIKFREGFRPFAPAVLESKVSEYFEFDSASPYMLMVAPVAKKHLIALADAQQELTGFDRLRVARSTIPSVTHVDNSSRIQTVSETDNQLFHRLLTAFERKTGTPLLLNTSFNVSEEPIVCTPADAYNCFMACDLDFLVIGPYLLDKQLQPAAGNDDDSVLSGKTLHTEADIRQYRIFGVLFGVIAIIGSIPLFLNTHMMTWPALIGGLALLFFGLFLPKLLAPLYKGWMKFGTVVGGVVTKCLLIIFYYLALYPCALAARISGKQFLTTKPDKSQASYWQPSVVPTDEQASGHKQY